MGGYPRRLSSPSRTTCPTSPTSTPSGPSSSPRSTPPTASQAQGVRRGEARRSPLQPAPSVPGQRHRGHRGPQLLPPRRRRPAGHPAGRLGRRVQGPRRQAARGRQHHHPAAGPLALPPPGGQPPAQAQGALRLPGDREALSQREDPRALLQPLLPRPRRLRRPGRRQPLLRQGRQGPRPRSRRP
ncbi:MAG: hypothetical protein M0C28_48340 [Candidatus Moduliflexus flocculans]|nr:hypothetical protein [Candidatus Moduliflexus flocculans]